MNASGTRPLITLTTDFGLSDHYAGVMKCVILDICAGANIVDITHQIAPCDVVSAAYAVSQAAPFSGAGAIHVVVVDPGVGTPRRAIALRTASQTFIAPDNGVLSLVMTTESEIRELVNPKLGLPVRSNTFHGRDLFAPAAAHLAAGSVAWEDAGPMVDNCVRIPGLIATAMGDGAWSGMAISIDHFGNIVTNFPARLIAGMLKEIGLSVGERSISRILRTFGEAKDSEPFLYAGSSGYIEAGINRGNAATKLDVRVGDPLVLTLHF